MCFDNFISAKSVCNTTASTSGYDITDLPGISLKIAGDVADSDYRNGADLLQKKIDFATKVAVEEFANKVRDYMRVSPLIEMQSVGEWVDDQYLDPAAGKGGMQICIKRSNFTKLMINRVRCMTDTDLVGKEITIKDGQDVGIYTVDLSIGVEAAAEIGRVCQNDRVYIYWFLGDVTTNISKLKHSNCRGCGTTSPKTINYNYATVSGWYGDNDISTDDTFGLAVDFSVICDAEAILCQLKHKLAYPILLKCGIEFLKEVIHSTRFGAITSIYAEDAKELIADYQHQYDELLKTFAKEASSALARIGDPCITCNTDRKVVIRA